MLNIKGIAHETMDCFDKNVVLPVADYYGMDYFYALLYAYKVCYTPVQENNSLLRNSLLDFGSKSRRESIDIWKTAYNFDYEWIDKKENENGNIVIQRIVENIMNSAPVCLVLDSYYCNWNEYYLRLHVCHSLLLIGVDSDNSEFVCIDTYLSNKVQRIDFDIVKIAYEWIILFRGKNLKIYEHSEEKDKRILNSLYGDLSVSEFISTFYDLKKDIISYRYNRDKDGQLYNDVNQSIFLSRLTALGWSRQNFADAIVHFFQNKRSVDLVGIPEGLIELSKAWIRIRNHMVRAIILGKEGDFVFAHFREKIEDVINLEEQIYRKFILYLKP